MKVWILTIMIAVIILSVGAVPVMADTPVPPHAFYGTVTINGFPAPVGTIIEASVTGVQTGAGSGNPIIVNESGKYGNASALLPRLLVQGNITDGATIHFYINGTEAAQTAAWHFGSLTELYLTFTMARATPIITLTSTGSTLFGQNITFTATISGGYSPSGTVTFIDGSTAAASNVALVNSTASYIGSLSLGNHSFTAIYNGDLQNSPVTSAAVIQQVFSVGTYSDAAHTSALTTFSSNNHTIYVYASGLTPNHTYTLRFLDNSGKEIQNIPANTDANGYFNSTNNVIACDLTKDRSATTPNWQIQLLDGSNTLDVLSVTVDSKAIPELSSVISALIIGVLCGGTYLCLSRRKASGLDSIYP